MNITKHIPLVNTYFRGQELKAQIKEIGEGKGLTPDEIEDLLNLDTTGGKNFLTTAGLTGASIFSDVIRRIWGENLHGIELPDSLHEIGQAFYNLTVNSADSNQLIDHLPFVFITMAALSFGDVIYDKMGLKGKKEEIKKLVTDLLEKGELAVKLSEGHSALFSGEGFDYLATHIHQKTKEGDSMIYSTEIPDTDSINIDSEEQTNLWIKTTGKLAYNSFKEQLEKGDFQNAGEAILFPINKDEMFLPNPENKEHFDMNIDGIKIYQAMFNQFCEEKGIDKKRIIIVGDKNMYQEQKISNDIDNSIKTTLGDFSENYNQINLVDPTDLVLDLIKERVGDDKISFKANTEDFEKYFETFEKRVKEKEITILKNDDEIGFIIHYNSYDDATISDNESDSKTHLYIIIDPEIKETAIANGIDEKNIILVPEVVYSKIDKLNKETLKSKKINE